jgi:alkanesulfonate monooxygenase SsuD/methylene tetrahydromethanopterin reductase-like flavin-dependent oxidoreductase (luciferase family)
VRLGLRYDLRSPAIGAGPPRLWPAAVEQCAWADQLGFETVLLGEHHGDPDGYNPAPIVLAGAILARSERITTHLSALIVTLHDPVRLAEDLAALSLIGDGRVEVTVGMGYRPHEYAMFGVDGAARRKRLDEAVAVMLAAWRGEELTREGAVFVVRPLPPAGRAPKLFVGGSTEGAARRAGRAGLGFRPGVPALWEPYVEALEEAGHPVPERPSRSGPSFLFVTHDPERDLALLAPNLLDTTNTYAQWALERGSGSTKYEPLTSAGGLREKGFRFVTPAECVALAQDFGPDGELRFHPLMGGIDPDVAWRSLELFETAVLPELERLGLRAPVAQRA